jgi:hypothetical protein
MAKALDGGGGVSLRKFDVNEETKFDPIQRTRIANSYVVWQSDSQSQGINDTNPNDVWDTSVAGESATLSRGYTNTRLQVGAGSRLRIAGRNFAWRPLDATVHTFIQFAYFAPTAANVNRTATDGMVYKAGIWGWNNGHIPGIVTLEISGSSTAQHETLTLVNGINFQSDPVWHPPNIRVAQSNWNIDRLDGTGPSKINISQRSGDTRYPYVMDGVFALVRGYTLVISQYGGPLGMTRIGFVFDNAIYYAHEFSVARLNVFSSGLSEYPIKHSCVPFVELQASADIQMDSVGIMNVAHASVVVEGPLPVQRATHVRACDTGASTVNSGASGTFVPLVSIRTASNDPPGTFGVNHSIAPVRLSLANTGATLVCFRMVLNATLTGPAFADIDVRESIVAADTSATALSDGRVVVCGHVPAGSTTEMDLSSTCGVRPIGVTSLSALNETYTLAATTASSTPCAVSYALTWQEFH